MRLEVAATIFSLALLGCSDVGTAGREAGTADLPGERASGEGSVACTRRVLEAEVTNARDVGGHPLAGRKQTACRRFLRGGDLGRLSASGCSELAALGIKTVIDLRAPAVQQSEPPPACVSGTRVLAPLPKLLPDTPENYLALFQETASIAKVFATLGDAAAYPVYLHCVIGRDRASFMTALVLSAVGASHATVVEEFKLSAEAGVAVKPKCVEATLDEVDRRGGIEGALTAAGVTSSELGVLRAELAR
jgi:hypothetical protein